MKNANSSHSPKRQANRRSASFARVLDVLGGKRTLAIGLALSACESLCFIAISTMEGRAIDQLRDWQTDGFRVSIVLALLATLGITVTIILKDGVFANYMENGVFSLKLNTIGALFRARWDRLRTHHSGDLTARISADMSTMANSVRPVLIFGFASLLGCGLTFLYSMLLNWRLSLIIFAIIPVSSAIQWALSKQLRHFAKQSAEAVGALASVASDSFGMMETVKAYAMEQQMLARFGQSQQSETDALIHIAKRANLIRFVATCSRLLPQMIILWIGGQFVLRGEITIGDLLIFVKLSQPAFYVFTNIPEIVKGIQSTVAAGDRVLKLWELPGERLDGQNFLTDADEAVSIRDASYQYDGGAFPLHGINLTLQTSEAMMLCGESGCGKTTLLNLITGLCDVSGGEIDVLGHPIRQWSLAHLREKMSYVPQEPCLFSGTILENIGSGEAVASGELRRILELVELSDYLDGLPDGLQTQTGERGVFLSGGQRQRLALARALVKGANLLVMDEALSAVDQEMAVRILKRLRGLGKTILLVSHQDALKKHCDRVVHMKDGIIEKISNRKNLNLKESL